MQRYSVVVDRGNIGPDYLPGHSHADTLSFELFVNGRDGRIHNRHGSSLRRRL